jgi:hypothetical protein
MCRVFAPLVPMLTFGTPGNCRRPREAEAKVENPLAAMWRRDGKRYPYYYVIWWLEGQARVESSELKVESQNPLNPATEKAKIKGPVARLDPPITSLIGSDFVYSIDD